MSSNFIHRVVNQSDRTLQLVFLSKLDKRSYDLVVGAGQSVTYDSIYGEGSAPVHLATANSFADAHVRVLLGDVVYALYEQDGKVCQTFGDAYSKDAKPIGGFAGPGPIELTIDGSGAIIGNVYDFATGPRLTAASWAAGRYAIYGISTVEEALVEKPFLTDHWSTWTTVGRPDTGLSGPLAAVDWAVGRFSVYALGKDGLMYEKAWLANRWEEWMQHKLPTGVKLRDLSAVKWETGRHGIYAVGEDGGLYQKWWGLDKWHDWESLGKPEKTTLLGPVTSVCWSAYRYGIYALGADGQIWQKWYGAGWSGWESTGSPKTTRLKTLCSASWADRKYVVAGVGEDGNLWTHEYSHGWSDWKSLKTPGDGIVLQGPVAAVSWAAGKMAYYAKGNNGLMYQFWDNKWSQVDPS